MTGLLYQHSIKDGARLIHKSAIFENHFRNGFQFRIYASTFNAILFSMHMDDFSGHFTVKSMI